jgi:protein lysine acetyltransferase
MTARGTLYASSPAAAESFVVANGTRISLRQISADDRAGMAALFAQLSPQSRYQRFLSPKPELTPRELTYFTDIDHLNHEAIAAVDEHDNSIVGVARYVRDADRPDAAELAIEVADAFQRMGIGTALTSLTIHHAHANGLTLLTATTLWENHAARRLLRRFGVRARKSRGGEIEHELKLEESSRPREAVCVPENPRLVARPASVPSPSSTGARRTPA